MSLDSIPNEIVSHLLYFLAPEDNLRCFQRLCKHLNSLGNSALLWRFHCVEAFKYWNPRHRLQRKLQLLASEVDWKRLFIVRKERNDQISRLLDGMLARREDRMALLEQICLLGYDAKDFLLEQCLTVDDAHDVLARRYYARHLLDSIHRSVAIEEWQATTLHRQDGHGIDHGNDHDQCNAIIEKCLAAMGMFVLHNQYGDINEVSLTLDKLAHQFRESEPNLEILTSGGKALALNSWLRTMSLTGMARPERNYRRLRNCFIGQALLHAPHESLPLISSAIYCSLAARIGIAARSCLFPGHVYVAVLPPPGKTLDDIDVPVEGANSDDGDGGVGVMYLDPYGADGEVSETLLRGLVNSLGWRNNTQFFSPATPLNLLMRMGHNVAAALGNEPADDAYAGVLDPTWPVSGLGVVNIEAAKLLVLWLRFVAVSPGSPEWKERVAQLASVSHGDDGAAVGNVWLFRRYVHPKLDDLYPPWRRRPGVLDLDGTLVEPPAPGGEAARDRALRRWKREFGLDPVYHVGQVVYNRNRNYIAVVYGWSGSIVAGRTMTDNLENFYYKLLCAGEMQTRKMVKHANVLPVTDRAQIPPELFELAGIFFDRFDGERCHFVPSADLRRNYPEG